MAYSITAAVTDPNRASGPEPTLEHLQLRAPGEGEVVVAIKAVGICHTDFFAGSLSETPMVPGHEGAGIIEAVGSGVDPARIGERVALTFDSCGTCKRCHEDDPAYCESALELQFGLKETMQRDSGERVKGAFFKQSSFATHVLATARNSIPIDDDLPFDLAAPLGCGIQTGYGAVVNEVKPRTDETLVVFGLGAVGLSAVSAAFNEKVRHIIAIDPIEERRTLALEMGATDVFAPEAIGTPALSGRIADCAIDCAGTATTFQQGIDMLKARGRFGVVAVPPPDKPISFVPLTLLDGGRQVFGIVEGGSDPTQFIPQLGRLALSGALPLEKMIKRYTFSNFSQAWNDAAEGKTIKPVLVMDP
ncbi:MAG: alcohol dehydrogenase catalytic domain-containing protein [Pseudomonadota bacterium]